MSGYYDSEYEVVVSILKDWRVLFVVVVAVKPDLHKLECPKIPIII